MQSEYEEQQRAHEEVVGDSSNMLMQFNDLQARQAHPLRHRSCTLYLFLRVPEICSAMVDTALGYLLLNFIMVCEALAAKSGPQCSLNVHLCWQGTYAET